ncbi:MAG: hypothetical protein ABI743_07520 [bacterium]
MSRSPLPLLTRISLVALLLWVTLVPSTAAPMDAIYRLTFLRQGSLWSCKLDGAEQTQLVAGGTIQRYALEQPGDRAAIVRRVQDLDTLEVLNLATQESTLVRAAAGWVDDFCWSRGKEAVLGYLYRETADAAPTLWVSRGAGPGKQRYVAGADERILFLYPAAGGVVLVSKRADGLRWNLCTADDTIPITGFPGKTITAMPLDGELWLGRLYAPNIGRSLTLWSGSRNSWQLRNTLDLPRADLEWSAWPVRFNAAGMPLRIVLTETTQPELDKPLTHNFLIWDLEDNTLERLPLGQEVLLGPPVIAADRFVYCCQLKDGSGYGTPASLWARDWRERKPRLLVADGSSPQVWVSYPTPVAAPVTEPPVVEPAPEPEVVEPAPEEPVPSPENPEPVDGDSQTP